MIFNAPTQSCFFLIACSSPLKSSFSRKRMSTIYIYIFFKHKMFFNATMQFFCFLKLYFIRATCTSRFIYFFGLLLHALKVETSLSFPPSFTSLYTVPLVISLPAGPPPSCPTHAPLPSKPLWTPGSSPFFFFFFPDTLTLTACCAFPG